MLIKRRKNPLFTLWDFNSSSFEQTWIPIIQGCIVRSLVQIGPVVLEKKSKIGKVYRQTYGQTDDGQQVIRIAQLSFQLRWAKNHWVSFNQTWQEAFLAEGNSSPLTLFHGYIIVIFNQPACVIKTLLKFVYY